MEGGAVEALDHQPGDKFADRGGFLDALCIFAGVSAGAHLGTGAAGVEDRLRELTPRVVGVLTRRYGDFDAAEDAVDDAKDAADEAADAVGDAADDAADTASEAVDEAKHQG